MSDAKINPNGPLKALPFLISLVIPGNPYPVTEKPFIEENEKREINPVGLLGQACKPGHQSHYVIIDSAASTGAFPTKFVDFDDPGKERVVSDELVVFEGAQALPLFLVYYKAPASSMSTEKSAPPLTRQEMFSMLPSTSSSGTDPAVPFFFALLSSSISSFQLQAVRFLVQVLAGHVAGFPARELSVDVLLVPWCR